MTTFTKVGLILIALASLVTGAGYYYYKSGATAPLPSGVVVRDLSDSSLSDCGCTAALVRRALSDSKMRRGSTVTVIGTGDAKTADEPMLVASYDVPIPRRVIEGSNAANHKIDGLIEDLRRKCEQLTITKRSPIELAIRRGVERLRHEGCGPASGCFVYAQTDGEETAETQLKKRLDGDRSSREVGVPLIDNEGIDVVLFGLSQTLGEKETSDGRQRQFTRRRDDNRAKQLRTAWLSVFTHPERVVFEPFCPTN